MGQEDSLENGIATHSSFLAWRIPWREEPGWPQSMEWQRVGHDWATNTFPGGSDDKEFVCNAGDLGRSLGLEDPLEKEMAIHYSILPWRIPWTQEPGRLQSMGWQNPRQWFFQWSCMDVRAGLWRKPSAEELMLFNCGVGEDSCVSLGLQGDPTSPS